MTDEERKEWIRNASYEELLRKWRFSKIGDPFFQGEVGEFYASEITRRRDANPSEHVRASKAIGWER